MSRLYSRRKWVAALEASWWWWLAHPRRGLTVARVLARAEHRRSISAIVAHDAFDGDHYCSTYPDVAASALPPVVHYVAFGAREGRNPHPSFETLFYLEQNPDVRASGINPFSHFLTFGWREGRLPAPLSKFFRTLGPPAGSSGPRAWLDALAEQTTRFKDRRLCAFIAWPEDWAPSCLIAAAERLRSPDSLGRIASSVHCHATAEQCAALTGLFPDWTCSSGSSVRAAHDAIRGAARARQPLLLVLDGAVPPLEALFPLIDQLDADPLFATAHPRFRQGGRWLPVLDEARDDEPIGAARSSAARHPDRYVLPEYVSRCFLVRWEVAANIPFEPDATGPLIDALFEWLRRARRVGFRSALDNRAIVDLASAPFVGAGELMPTRLPDDSRTARRRFIDPGLESRVREAPLERSHPKVLLDARSLAATVNGTVKAALGFCDGLRALAPRWTIELVTRPDAARFHQLSDRYPTWTVHTSTPRGSYEAAIRLCQPWHLEEMTTLHELARTNIYVILDTIAWDIVYAAPDELDAVWRAMAASADGLVFISEFSRERFRTRFGLQADMQTTVCHLSLDPRDYWMDTLSSAPSGPPYWLVVGNAFEHKWVQPTLAHLTRQFPGQRLVALGASNASSGKIEVLASGTLDESAVQALYAHADAVIFPSFYEGFGLPIVNALAYGRIVAARNSSLLDELMRGYGGPGEVRPFADDRELDAILLHLDNPRTEQARLTGRAGVPHGWCDAAACLAAFVDRVMRAPSQDRAARRDLLAAVTRSRREA